MSLKFVEDKFDEKQQSTINASYLDKTLTLSNNKDIKLAIWVLLWKLRTLPGRKCTMPSFLSITGMLTEQ